MPIMNCQLNNKPGFKFGPKGTCYTYNPESKQSISIAKRKALDQGIAIGEYLKETIQRLYKLRNKKR